MTVDRLSDLIRSWPDALTPEHCADLIARFEASPELERCEREGGHGFTQLDISAHWPADARLLSTIFAAYLGQYQAAVEVRFWPPQFAFEHLRIKRYLPNGRDAFPAHVDVMTQAAARRFMTAIIYLNAPQGGMTVFPALSLEVAPQTGKLVAFPPLWLFPHAGLPPIGGPKYILHTYMCYPV